MERPPARGRSDAPPDFGGLHLRMVSPAPWRPPTEVRATADAVFIVIELAALDEAHTEVGLYDDVLVVEGSRRVDVGPWGALVGTPVRAPIGGSRTHDGVAAPEAPRSEILQGPFRVEVPLPFEIDQARVDATYDDGLLRIVLPRLPLDDVGLPGLLGPRGRVA
jgi:HSP20 family molecular chaperone IbpA